VGLQRVEVQLRRLVGAIGRCGRVVVGLVAHVVVPLKLE
jgi:hypothetical protein